MAKAKNLEWGSANRPKVSNKLGMPHSTEGSDGDFQVRQTSAGARLFAKLGGRWLSNLLYGDVLESPNIFIPKAWYSTGKTSAYSSASSSGAFVIPLPEFINAADIISIGFMINLGSDALHAWAWDIDTSSNIKSPVASAELYYDRSRHSVVLSFRGSATGGKTYRLTVFFK